MNWCFNQSFYALFMLWDVKSVCSRECLLLDHKPNPPLALPVSMRFEKYCLFEKVTQ